MDRRHPKRFRVGDCVYIAFRNQVGWITHKFPYEAIDTAKAPGYFYRVWWENQDEFEVDVFLGSEMEHYAG